MTSSFPPDVSIPGSDLSSDLADTVNRYNDYVTENKSVFLTDARKTSVENSVNKHTGVMLEARIEHFLSENLAENNAGQYDPDIVSEHTESLLNTVNNKYRETFTTRSKRVEESVREGLIVGCIGGFAAMPAIHDWAPYVGIALSTAWGVNHYLEGCPNYADLQAEVEQEVLSTADDIQDEHGSGGEYSGSTTPPTAPPDQPRKRL